MICSLCGSDVSRQTKAYCQQCVVTRDKYLKELKTEGLVCAVNSDLATTFGNVVQGVFKQMGEIFKKAYEETINDNTANPNANMEQIVSDEQVGKNEGSPSNSRVRISCTSYRKRLADFDGISYKAAIDGLKAIGVLKDDSTQYVSEEATVNQKKSVGDESTVIEIWEE